LPGLFLCFLYRFDHFNNISFKNGYFLRGWIGYAVGLFVTFIMLIFLERGQPALLYLVPGTMLPTVFFGWRRNQLSDLWNGLYNIKDLEKAMKEMQNGTPSSNDSAIIVNSNSNEDTISLLRNPEERQTEMEEIYVDK